MEGNHRVYRVMYMGINNGVMGKNERAKTVICVDNVNSISNFKCKK